MSVKEIIQKIKLFLNEENEIKLTDVKTTDGLILNYEGELVPGIEIFIVDETGKNPAPDATYILEDKTEIVVVEGKVESIEIPTDVPGTETETEMPKEEAPIEPVVKMEEILSIVARLEKLEEENLELKEILRNLATNLSTKELNEEIKMSMVSEKVVEKHNIDMKPLNSKQTELSNIFRNMYK
jgi:hypothetical protein